MVHLSYLNLLSGKKIAKRKVTANLHGFYQLVGIS